VIEGLHLDHLDILDILDNLDNLGCKPSGQLAPDRP
jgi:hypothetical protein